MESNEKKIIVKVDDTLKMAKTAIEFINQIKEQGKSPTAEQYEVAYNEMKPVVEAAKVSYLPECHFDMTEAIKYLENVCPPETIGHYIIDAQTRLLNLLASNHTSFLKLQDEHEIIEDVININATLKICLKVFDGMEIKNEE